MFGEETVKVPKISVIIPMYNVAPYLERCLKSVEAQTFRDFEVVLINDGSNDNSLEIAKAFAERNDNFRLISQHNKGIAEVRNIGVAEATGEFIAFIDSDDFIMAEYLEKLYNAAVENDADVATCNYINGNIQGTLRMRNLIFKSEGVYGREEILKNAIRDFSVRNYSWNKLWRRKLFTENNIVYPELFFEDAATTPKLFFYAKKTVVIKDQLYYYTQRSDSITGLLNPCRIRDYLTSFGIMRSFLEENGSFKPYRFSFYILKAKICVTALTWVIMWGVKSKKPKNLVTNTMETFSYLNYYSGKNYIPTSSQQTESARPVLL